MRTIRASRVALTFVLLLASGAQAVTLEVIAGYLPLRSVAQGEELPLHLASPTGRIRVIIYREGVLSREVTRLDLTNVPALEVRGDIVSQGLSLPEAARIPVTREWRPGVYRAVFEDPDGKLGGEATLFVVKPRKLRAFTRIAYVSPMLTHHAASDFGGEGIRKKLWQPEAGVRQSLHRPTRSHLFDWLERPLLRWLESQLFIVDVLCEEDIEALGAKLNGYDALILPPLLHYLPREAYLSILRFRNSGGNIIHLGGHSLTDQVRFSESRDAFFSYHYPELDPLYQVEDDLLGIPMRHPLLGKDESGILGTRWERWNRGEQAAGFVINEPEHWALAGTGLGRGARLAENILGMEWDSMSRPGFPGLSAWAISPLEGLEGRLTESSAVSIIHDPAHGHPTGQGGQVFSVGSALWPQGLRDGIGRRVPEVSTITENALIRLGKLEDWRVRDLHLESDENGTMLVWTVPQPEVWREAAVQAWCRLKDQTSNPYLPTPERVPKDLLWPRRRWLGDAPEVRGEQMRLRVRLPEARPVELWISVQPKERPLVTSNVATAWGKESRQDCILLGGLLPAPEENHAAMWVIRKGRIPVLGTTRQLSRPWEYHVEERRPVEGVGGLQFEKLRGGFPAGDGAFWFLIGAVEGPEWVQWPMLSVLAEHQFPLPLEPGAEERAEALTALRDLALPEGPSRFQIVGGGFLGSVVQEKGGILRLAARVSHPQGPQAVAAVWLELNGQPLLELADDGQHGDLAAGDGVWCAAKELGGRLPNGEYLCAIGARDAAGEEAEPWPYAFRGEAALRQRLDRRPTFTSAERLLIERTFPPETDHRWWKTLRRWWMRAKRPFTGH